MLPDTFRPAIVGLALVSEANSLPIWLPDAIRDLTSVDPGTIEITDRQLTTEIDFIRFLGSENGVLGRISRTQQGWAGPISLSLQRIDAIQTTGQVPTFNAHVGPNGEVTERRSDFAVTSTIEIVRPEE